MNETLYSLTNTLFPHLPAPGNHYSILWFYEFDNSIRNEIIDFSFCVSLIPFIKLPPGSLEMSRFHSFLMTD